MHGSITGARGTKVCTEPHNAKAAEADGLVFISESLS